MNVLKMSIALLLVFGVSFSMVAWHITLFNETPFQIKAKAKSWKGALKGQWKLLHPYDKGKVSLPGADCIDGMWIHMILPTGGQAKGFEIPTLELDLGYYRFGGNRCSNTYAVFGVTPQIVTKDVKNPSQTAAVVPVQTQSVTSNVPAGPASNAVSSLPVDQNVPMNPMQVSNALNQFTNKLNDISKKLNQASTGGIVLTEHDYKSVFSGFDFYVGHMQQDKMPVKFEWDVAK